MSGVICILVVAVVGVAVCFLAKYMVKNEILDTTKTIIDQRQKIEEYAQGTVIDTADISYRQVVQEVDQFLKRAKAFPEYLDRIRADIMGNDAVTMEMDIGACMQKAQEAQEWCAEAEQQLHCYAEDIRKMTSYTADRLKGAKLPELWSIRKEQKHFKAKFDELVSRSEQGHTVVEKAKTDIQTYNRQCSRAAQAIRPRWQEWQKRKFVFSIQMEVEGGWYSHAADPREFVIRLSDMKFIGLGKKTDISQSQVIFEAYQKAKVLTAADGTLQEKTLHGMSVLQMNADGRTELLTEIDEDSQGSFTDPQMQKRIDIVLRANDCFI